SFRLLSLFDLARPLVGLLLSLVGLLLLPLVGFARPLVDLGLFLVPLRLLLIPRLALIGLRRTLCIRAVLVHILFLLDLLLFDPLALLVLFQAQILNLLLLFLFRLRIRVAGIGRARRRWPVVEYARVAAVAVSGCVAQGIAWTVRLAWLIHIPLLIRIARIRIRRLVVLNVWWRVVRRRICRVRVSRPRSIRIALPQVLPIVLTLLVRQICIGRRPLPVRIALLRIRAVVTRILRWTLAHRRRHLDVGPLDLRIFLLLDAAHLGDRWRSATVLPNDFLLLGESDRSRRRRHLGHNGPADNRARRSHAGHHACANYAALLRRNRWRHRSNRSRSHFIGIHANHVVVHGSRGNESFMRGGRNGVHLRPVLISNVRDVRRLVHINVVVDVGHLHAVDDGGVRDVHVGHVPLADVVRRAIHVTRSQREPRHAGGHATSDHSDSPMRAAN